MRRLLFIASIVSGALFLLAKELPSPAPTLSPVKAIVTIEARNGTKVPSLLPGDVMAKERNQGIPVSDVVAATGENAGLELFVLVDDSSNATVGSQFGDLTHFMETQPATTAIGVAYLRNGMADVLQNLTADHDRAARSLRVPMMAAGASPYLSFSDLIKRWPNTAARREVVLVTSGVDALGGTGPMDHPYLDVAIDDAQRNGIIVYAIYMPAVGHAGHSFFQINWGQNNLAQLAEETGGESYLSGFGPPISFAPYLEDVAGHLTHQYRVTLLMKPEAKGSLRTVRFTTEVPNAELVAAKKVFVPGAAK